MNKEDKIKIFLVDDDAMFLSLLELEFIRDGGFDVETYGTGELCIENLSRTPDVIILDYHLDGVDKSAMNGMETLDRIKAVYPDLPVVILSGMDRIDLAVNFMHHQALDFVVKNASAFFRIKKSISILSATKSLTKSRMDASQ